MDKLKKLGFVLINLPELFRFILTDFKQNILLYWIKIKWTKLNKHNYTFPVNYFHIHLVTVGKHSYGPLYIYSWNKDNERLVIGNYVSIADGVKFILGGNHFYKHLSLYPFKSMVMETELFESYSKGSIIVEDDVWFGTDALILSGVKIGKGAIIAAKSVVTRDVPPYSIVAGAPARVVKYRFNEDIIKRLETFDYNKINKQFVESNLDLLYQPLNSHILDKLLPQILLTQ